MAEGLVKKKRLRAGHKASATRMLHQVDGLLTAPTPDKSRLRTLNLSLQEKLETLKVLDGEVLDLVEEESLADEIEQADLFKEGIYAAMINIEKRCATPPTTGPVEPTSGLTRAETLPTPRGHRVKLPKLTIRPFNGDITMWTTFWDSYESAIHNSTDLSDIDKFNYLKSLLERTAYEAIAGLTLTSANYHEAITVLKKRFGNKQQIISKHMDILLYVEPVTSQHNLKGLRHLCDLVESQVRSLKSLGVASESYGSLLSSVLLNKLPQELRLIVSRKITDEEWNLDALLKVVGQEVEARERTLASSSQPGKSSKIDRGQHTAAALMSGSSNPSCCYCRQLHSSSTCKVVTQTEARKQILRRSGRCFNCLRRGHIGRECRSAGRCHRCGGRHHASICSRSNDKEVTQPPLLDPAGTVAPPDQHFKTPTTRAHESGLNPQAAAYTATPTTNLYVCTNKTVLLQTARTVVYNPNATQHSLELRAIFDSGSQRSYITSRAKNALALIPEGEQHVSIVTFGSSRGDPTVCPVVRVGMRTRSGRGKEFTLLTVPQICEPLSSQPITLSMERYDHLSGLELADFSDGETPLEVDVLIGSDHYWDLITGETLRGESGPIAIHTELGWVLSGPVQLPELHQSSVSLVTTHTLRVDSQQLDTAKLDDRLRSFWELESLGIQNPESSVYEDFGNNVHFKDGRYEVALPWKVPHDPLPDNYHLSSRRLQGLLRRLRQNPAILRQYDSVIREQIQQGVVEVVENPETNLGKTHYLPHHAVVRQDKETTKLRVVFDASAKSDGPSLNDCLYTGPKFDQRIMDILLRFRTHRVALTGDIEKAFLMISVAKNDQDVLRFLWVDDVSQDPPSITALKFTRVVFGVSSSPFLLNATIRHHLEGFLSSHPELVPSLTRSIYVDDVVHGADNDDDAYKVYAGSKDILRQGGFNLRKFTTNSRPLQERINREEGMHDTGALEVGKRGSGDSEQTYAKSTLGCTQEMQSGEQKILGVRWNVHSDCFVFSLDDIALLAKTLEPTKRHVVSIVGKFYDPLGFMSPVIIRFKMFFQELCESKVEWDQPLSGRLLGKWRSLIMELQYAQPMSIPRCYLSGVNQNVKSYSLCGFCDASNRAYAAVVYLLMKTDTDCHVRFVASKTRVSPVRGQTIPRLELLSALLLARLITSVIHSLESELQLSPPRCFTDSEVTLYWIRGRDKEWKPFVQNRVNEIRKLLPVDCWRHCPGKDNPADLPSRGVAPLELSVNVLWNKGPSWLNDQEPNVKGQDLPMPKECVDEMKAKDRKSAHSMLVTETPAGLGRIMACENYSTLPRLLRVTARLLRIVKVHRRKNRPDLALEPITPSLGLEEISEAERLWIIESQLMLTKDSNFDIWKKQFGLFLDENGIWRCGGRLSNTNLPFSTKHPILLHRNHHLTILIVKSAHARVLHDGVKETLTELRARYWIVKGRSLVRSVILRCILCRRFEVKPYGAPPPPPLPPFRVKEEPPFTYTGLDFAGPL